MIHLRAAIACAGSAWILFAAAGLPSPAQAQSLSRPAPGRFRGPLYDHVDWMSFHESGWRAMNKGWYDSAQREFTSAIEVAKRPSLSEPRLLARSYSSLAWALQKQGKIAEAEPLARWALATRQAQFGPDAEPVARSLNQMATIYLELNRFDQAEPLLRRVAAMGRGNSPTMAQEQAQSESLLGLGMVAQRRYADGEKEFAKAVVLLQTHLGAKNPETGDELNNLAWSQIEQGKLVEARSSMDKALQILGQGRGEADPSVARALDGLIRIDIEQNDLGAAEIKFRRLIAIREQAGPDERERLKDGLQRYASLLDRLGQADAARQARARLTTINAARPARASIDGNFAAPRYPTTPPPTPGPAPRGGRS